MVRPFTFNGKQTLLFANINDFLGFEVADLNCGQILYHVEVPGVTAGRLPTHGIPSHGIAMTQKQIVATLQDENGLDAESEKMLEIDFAGGKPVVAADQFGKGKKR